MKFKHQYRITISDINGTHHFNIKKILFRYALYALIFLTACILIGALTISYLSHKVSKIKQDLTTQHQQELLLKDDIKRLNAEKKSVNSTVNVQEKKYTQLNEKVKLLENTLHINGNSFTDTSKNTSSLRDTGKLLHLLTQSGVLRTAMLQLIPNGSPIKYSRISSPFKDRINPITHKREHHPGDDLVAPTGTPVYAPADGVVAYIRPGDQGYGNFIIVDHAFGFSTLYGHLSRFNVKYGQFVHKGDLIAWSGSTGESTGPHLHYEVRFLSRVLDPINFIHWSATHFSNIFKKETHIQWASLTKVMHQETKVLKQLLLPRKQESRAY